VYERLNGLDEVYRNGYEDCDFCLRAREAGLNVVYHPASIIYHYGQSTEGRTETDNQNWQRFHSVWGEKLEPDLERLSREDHQENRRRIRKHKTSGPGLHVCIDTSIANAFLWATVDLLVALEKRGVPISIPKQPTIHRSVSKANRKRLRNWMRLLPRETYHIKWTHYWPHHQKEVLFGEVNAEFFCTNYRYDPEAGPPDLWMRHVAVNEYRKLPVAGFNLDALGDIGITAEQARVMPLGYSPEIETLYPQGMPDKPEGKDLKILLVTNSHDLHRYGTDLAIQALSKAFSSQDPVEVHIKDYGASSGSRELQDWIEACGQFPRVVWHNTFVPKEKLLKLYAGMDVQLAPFRGEGFSMKILDAAALGVPTLMPAFGGPMEYSTPETMLPIRHREVPVQGGYDVENAYLGKGAYWCEPDVEHMVEQLQTCEANRALPREVGKKALEHVRGRYSWDASAETLMLILEGWASERRVRVATRNLPPTCPLTVIIPTKDREDILDLTLTAYGEQTLPADQFELLVINDHGSSEKVQSVVKQHPGLQIRFMDNPGQGGPAAARNLAIEHSRGEVVLITGDDIVPCPDFLKEHLDAHRKFPEMEAAFVGFTDWHPDLEQTPFMSHITGKGGQQFKYDDMRNEKLIPFDRLYTSNCSIKRDLLNEEELLFSTRYRYAAYEDVELGYRLHLRGMKLRHLSNAVGYHHHQMTPASFVRRQRLVGRMLTLMTIQRPVYVPNEHQMYLQALECWKAHPGVQKAASKAGSTETWIQELLTVCEAMLEAPRSLQEPADRTKANQDAALWAAWLKEGIQPTWETLNQLILRKGMVEEWMGSDASDEEAAAWVTLIAMPNLTGYEGPHWKMPFSRPDFTTALAPDSKLVYLTAKLLRGTPLLGPALHSFEHSPLGGYVRKLISSRLSK
jgi:GT2 family glycosyltransferase